jgi:TOBE domain
VRVEIAEAPDRKPSFIAEITPAAVADLELMPGSEMWAAVKASDIEVYSATWFRAASVLFLHWLRASEIARRRTKEE